MSAPERANPYTEFAGTPAWSVLDRAVQDLIENRDLVETTDHTLIVGYLCKALVSSSSGVKPEFVSHLNGPPSADYNELIARIQRGFRAANPHQTNLLEDFLAERRAEADRE